MIKYPYSIKDILYCQMTQVELEACVADNTLIHTVAVETHFPTSP